MDAKAVKEFFDSVAGNWDEMRATFYNAGFSNAAGTITGTRSRAARDLAETVVGYSMPAADTQRRVGAVTWT